MGRYKRGGIALLKMRGKIVLPDKLDDTALQLYKGGDYGAYLDLEASINEQQEEFEGFHEGESMGQHESGGRSDRSRQTGRATEQQEEERRQADRMTEKEKTRCSLSVIGQSFFRVLTVRFLAASLAIDRNCNAIQRGTACSRMISLRATRPGSLRPPHCGREFCPVCRQQEEVPASSSGIHESLKGYIEEKIHYMMRRE
ncbi:hypothetical protein G5I_09667 [Acromyrmex echinatior]|uniref:FHOD1 N-terminal GTPase-binding domain-containing protein n=1 Tax=Acromyrmex echinatior TaxID=103372 RepID=F4WUT8_ACREC|nr:hypothetical protein G5I_09667 [Acromyrmex echinatior]